MCAAVIRVLALPLLLSISVAWASNEQQSHYPYFSLKLSQPQQHQQADYANKLRQLYDFVNAHQNTPVYLAITASQAPTDCQQEPAHIAAAKCAWKVPLLRCTNKEIANSKTTGHGDHHCRGAVILPAPFSILFNQAQVCEDGSYQLVGFYQIRYTGLAQGFEVHHADPRSDVELQKAVNTLRRVNDQSDCYREWH